MKIMFSKFQKLQKKKQQVQTIVPGLAEQGEVGLFFVFRYSIKREVSLLFAFRFSTFEFGPNIAF